MIRRRSRPAAILVWSSKTGLHFDGQVALKLTIPVDIGFGPARISQIIVELDAKNGGVGLGLGVSGSGKLGPIAASVQDLGVDLALVPAPAPAQGTFGDLALGFGFRAPSGFGLSIDASVVSGGGFLAHVGDQYEGALQLTVCGIAVKAYGLIETGNGFSALVILSTEFSPGLQLGYGFTLDGVGGLVGVNRTLALANVQSAIWSHHFDGLLFPANAITAAPSLMTAIGSYFPAADGRYLFGPLAKIGWGAGMMKAVVGLVLEVPEPLKLVLLGEIDVQVPVKLPELVLHIDFDGGVDFGQKLAFFDASLHDSKIAGYPLSGDLAFRYGWGDSGPFALSIGGFNPHYTPPADFPALKRIAISIGAPSVQLTAQGYLALTANTLQFGAKVELTAGTSALNVHGWLGFDALVEWSPTFAFTFDLSAGVDLRTGSTTLASVHLDGSVSGTSPWHVSCDASISFLFFDVSVHIDKSWGDAPPALPTVNPAADVLAALQAPSAWSGTTAPTPVTFASAPTDAAGAVLLEPSGGLRVTQKAAPLGQAITRYGGTPLPAPLTLNLDTLNIFGDTSPTTATEEFALAQFEDLSDAQKLSLPSFTALPAGVVIGGSGVDVGSGTRTRAVATNIGYETTILDSISPRPGAPYTLGAAAHAAMNARLVDAVPTPAPVTLTGDRYVIAGVADLKTRADLASDGSKRGALGALAAYLAANPGERGQLQVVLDKEAS